VATTTLLLLAAASASSVAARADKQPLRQLKSAQGTKSKAPEWEDGTEKEKVEAAVKDVPSAPQASGSFDPRTILERQRVR